MAYRVLLVVCALASCNLFAQETGSEQDAPDPVGFDRAPEAVEKLMEFTIDKEGRLRLRRDHWVEPEEPEEPDEKLSARELRMKRLRDPGPLGAPFGMAAPRTSPFRTVFTESMTAVGSRSRGGGGGSRGWYGRHEGDVVNAEFNETGSDITFNMREHSGQVRSIIVSDSDDRTRFLLVSPAGFVQMVRTDAGVHIASAIDGKIESTSGATFAHVVQAKPDYFKNRLSPALKGLAVLPVAAAEKFAVKESTSDTSMKLSNFTDGDFISEDVKSALTPLLQLQLSDRRLRVSRFAGDENTFDEELERLKTIYKEALTESIKRLKDRGGTAAQVGKLQTYMGQYGAPPPARFGRVAATPRGILFQRLERVAGGGTRGTSSGMNTFGANFKNEKAAGRIADSAKRQELELSNQTNQLMIHDRETSTRILAVSSTSFIHLVQSDEPAECGLSIVGPDKVVHVQARTYVDLLEKAKDLLHGTVMPTLAEYGIAGMDPFSKDITDAVIKQLGGDLATPVDVTTAKTAMESIVFPLLNAPEYLTKIADTLDDQQRKDVRKRVIGLRRSERKVDKE